MTKKSVQKGDVKSAEPVTPTVKCEPNYSFGEDHPYYELMNQVIDPEVGVGIADMGLIYNLEVEKGVAKVTMTLTSMGCPMGPELTTDIDGILRLEDDIKDVEIEVVWDPPWSPDKMKPEIRDMLFGI